MEPQIWKIEGLEAREDCERVVAQAQTAGRTDVRCVVLGRGADLVRATRWLTIAAGVPGYVGLAIGRTIWLQTIRDHLAGRLQRDEAVARIAANYRRRDRSRGRGPTGGPGGSRARAVRRHRRSGQA